jgi:hypothetical protein
VHVGFGLPVEIVSLERADEAKATDLTGLPIKGVMAPDGGIAAPDAHAFF